MPELIAPPLCWPKRLRVRPRAALSRPVVVHIAGRALFEHELCLIDIFSIDPRHGDGRHWLLHADVAQVKRAGHGAATSTVSGAWLLLPAGCSAGLPCNHRCNSEVATAFVSNECTI